MSYNLSVFHTLGEKYPTFAELETYLRSPEGGQLRSVSTIASGSSPLVIFRSVKGVSDAKQEHVKWFRSVIWDTVTNRPVCVAPPKADTTPVPTGESSKLALIQDFLDGTMINVFRTFAEPDRLQIATRTSLGANGKFYGASSFEQMFNDALAVAGLNREKLCSLLPSPTEEKPSVFASFVLQHPEHRVVTRCHTPRCWIVHVGSVAKSGDVEIDENLALNPLLARFTLTSYPMTGFRAEADLVSYFKGLVDSKGWFWQGLVFKDGKGGRWRLRNPNYLYLRKLRGSEATAVERFLRLRSESKVNEYLKHYGEERQVFWDLEEQLRQATRDVYAAYCSVHKSHERKLAELPKGVQPCVFRLHSHYLTLLKPNNEKVTMKNAVDLVNNMALFEQRRLMENAITLPPVEYRADTPSEVPPAAGV